MTWHLDEHLLLAYVDGRADAVRGNSVEQHVVRCADCRARLNEMVHDPMLGMVWDRVQEAVQSPAARAHRVLHRLGLPEHDALLLWAAPAFRAPWLAATAVTLAFVTLATFSADGRSLMFFVLVAPLIPVAGVALAYGPDADEAHETAAPTPYSALRLVLLRTVAVMATTLPATLAAGALVPGGHLLTVAWLAPAVAAVAATLALSTWMRVTWAAIGVAVGWCVLTAALAGPALSTPTLALSAALLPAYAVLALASIAVLVRRGDHLAHLGGSA